MSNAAAYVVDRRASICRTESYHTTDLTYIQKEDFLIASSDIVPRSSLKFPQNQKGQNAPVLWRGKW